MTAGNFSAVRRMLLIKKFSNTLEGRTTRIDEELSGFFIYGSQIIKPEKKILCSLFAGRLQWNILF